ncbi:MAG: hypothetical protein FJY66_04845, partial [Calditrichaeota bacterium]|nr:hypothetical protein [Calditrichota bacterium]
MMRKVVWILWLMGVLASTGFAQTATQHIPNYTVESRFLAGTPTATAGAAGAYFNPALWAMMKRGEVAFTWNDQDIRVNYLDNWGLFLGGGGLGFGMRNMTFPDSAYSGGAGRITDYQFALAGGDREWAFGAAYTFSRGNEVRERRDNLLTLGGLWRPCRYASLGLASAFALNYEERRAIADIGLRPFGTPLATLFADVASHVRQEVETVDWGAGIEVEPVSGIRLAL